MFEHVPQEDWKLLGFSPTISHPSWTISTCVAVLPNCLRPTDRARNQQNDITLLGEAIVRQVSLLKRNIVDKIPAWTPRTLLALNEWLDKAVETMLAFEINPMSESINYDNDSSEQCTLSSLKEETDTQAQTAGSEDGSAKKRAAPKSSVRKMQRVSFLNTAISAVQGAI